jgi:hypothetical protein
MYWSPRRIGLQAVRGGVLAGDRDLAVEPVLGEHGDDRAGQAVVGGDDAVDLAAVAGQDLLEGGAADLVVPLSGSAGSARASARPES